jgi:hypothetical protein
MNPKDFFAFWRIGEAVLLAFFKNHVDAEGGGEH